MTGISDRLMTWWQCKNCGEFIDDCLEANIHVSKCDQYENGDEVEFLFKNGPEKKLLCWISGTIDGTGEDRNGSFVVIKSDIGTFTLIVGENLIRKKLE